MGIMLAKRRPRRARLEQRLWTDCIYNSPGANTISRAKTPPPYLQQQRENSYNAIYRVRTGTALFTFKVERA